MKTEKAIVLCGAGGTGKTTTLNLVVDELIANGFAISKGSVSSSPKVDTIVSLEKDGNTIVVNTAGDNSDSVNRIKGYEGKSFDDGDLYILASRGRENCSSVDTVRKLFYENNIVWNYKWRITSTVYGNTLQETVNVLQAKEIVREALLLI